MKKAISLMLLVVGLLIGSVGSAEARTSYYYNSSRLRVHTPVYKQVAPAGASAQCRDGSYSFSQHRRGTCSYHGGVGRWLY